MFRGFRAWHTAAEPGEGRGAEHQARVVVGSGPRAPSGALPGRTTACAGTTPVASAPTERAPPKGFTPANGESCAP